jgi:hypothetical protein
MHLRRGGSQHNITNGWRLGMCLRPCSQHPACCFVLQDTSSTSRDSGAPPGVKTPAYQVVERARVDLGSAWGDTGRALQYSNTPEVRTPVGTARRCKSAARRYLCARDCASGGWVKQELHLDSAQPACPIVVAANPVHHVPLYHWHGGKAGLQLLSYSTAQGTVKGLVTCAHGCHLLCAAGSHCPVGPGGAC